MMKTLSKINIILVAGLSVCVFSLFAQEKITIADTHSPEKTTGDSVVIIPFGSAIRSDSVKASDLKKIQSKSVAEILRGRISELISYQTAYTPQKDTAQFIINCGCSSSLHTNSLILIDEVESSSDDLLRLNPDDIKSFSILKDAAALEMFGSRGTDGVIRITTKSGNKETIESEIKTNVEKENKFND